MKNLFSFLDHVYIPYLDQLFYLLAQFKIKGIAVGMLSVLIMTSVVGISFLSQHAEAAEGDDVTLRLKWLHQAQFAGFYT